MAPKTLAAALALAALLPAAAIASPAEPNACEAIPAPAIQIFGSLSKGKPAAARGARSGAASVASVELCVLRANGEAAAFGPFPVDLDKPAPIKLQFDKDLVETDIAYAPRADGRLVPVPDNPLDALSPGGLLARFDGAKRLSVAFALKERRPNGSWRSVERASFAGDLRWDLREGEWLRVPSTSRAALYARVYTQSALVERSGPVPAAKKR